MLDSKRKTETRQTKVITILKGSVGAARKVSPNWSQETSTCHSSNCFSIVWGQGDAQLDPVYMEWGTPV